MKYLYIIIQMMEQYSYIIIQLLPHPDNKEISEYAHWDKWEIFKIEIFILLNPDHKEISEFADLDEYNI